MGRPICGEIEELDSIFAHWNAIDTARIGNRVHHRQATAAGSRWRRENVPTP